MRKTPHKNTTTTPVLGLNSESMAGSSMVADGSTLDCAEIPKRSQTHSGLSVDSEPDSKDPKRCVLDLPDKLRCWFDQVVGIFLKEICTQDVFRPLPPMLGNGQRVDLLKLFWVVRKQGGFNNVSTTGVWDSVCKECGLGVGLGWAVKLVYAKYLYLLERVVDNKDLEWSLDSSGIDLGEHLMDLQDEITEFFSEISDRKLKDGGYSHDELPPKSFKDSNEVGSAVAESDRLKKSVNEELMDLDSRSVANVLDAGKSCNGDDVLLAGGGGKCSVNLTTMNLDSANSITDDGKLCDNDEVKSEVGESGRGKKSDDCDEDAMILDPLTVEEVSSFRKRKRESSREREVGESRTGKKHDSGDEEAKVLDSSTVEETSSFCIRNQESLCGMLNWVRMIAKDPCDPVVGSLPERSKWKSFGSENWMQVLWAREAIFLKRNGGDSGAEQSHWQKTQRMHPSMYDDQSGSAYNLRERLRLEKKLLSRGTMPKSGACSESSSGSDLDKSSPGMAGMEDQLLDTNYPPSHIPQGPNYQAHLPEWTGEVYESDLRWLGSRVWPLEKPASRYLIERDPIGRGRQESCGCQVPGSMECVRFHISERRLRIKQELGPAFYHWDFNQMGEEVGLPWTAEEEKKFKDIVKSNPPSLGITFWDDIYESFPKKSKRELVSYYFNVFLLHRRGYQNRFTPNNIDSDDEEFESGSATNGVTLEERKSLKSILKSPHKPHNR